MNNSPPFAFETVFKFFRATMGYTHEDCYVNQTNRPTSDAYEHMVDMMRFAMDNGFCKNDVKDISNSCKSANRNPTSSKRNITVSAAVREKMMLYQHLFPDCIKRAIADEESEKSGSDSDEDLCEEKKRPISRTDRVSGGKKAKLEQDDELIDDDTPVMLETAKAETTAAMVDSPSFLLDDHILCYTEADWNIGFRYPDEQIPDELDPLELNMWLR